MKFVDECRREWKRLGVPDAVANEMAAELTADLQEAEAEGASPEDVLGYAVFDARTFAATWAEERGVLGRVPPPRRRSFPVALVVVLAIFVVISVAGIAALIGVGTSSSVSARIAVGSSFPGRRIRKLLVPPPNRPFGGSGRARVLIVPPLGPGQLMSLRNPPATAGLVLLGIGIGGIAVTLTTWSVLDRRRRIIF